MKWVLDRVDGFPKNQRFVLGARLADGVLGVIEVLPRRPMRERKSLTCLLIMRFLVQGKRSLHRDPCNLTVLHVFDVGELGARRFPGPKWVRAKDAKDAKD